MRYIGIDLGDGESAVALLEENSVIEPVIQPIDGHGSILSVVGMSGTQVMIGEKALLDRKVVHLRTRFKSRYLTALDAERDIERFAFGVRSALINDDPEFFSDSYITVGCPAGWKDTDRERYAEIMRKAGFENVHIVSESRAAFFYARYAHELNVAPELLDSSTLVIDIGSSTTDFAYIVNGRESKIGTFGDVSLGGGLIEACMLRRAVAHSQQREALEYAFNESSSWKNRCEIVARRLKEQYFLSEEQWVNVPCVASETVYYDEPVKLRFELNEEIMREIISTPMDELNGSTFLEALSDLLRHANTSTKEVPPRLVILTGGASRMQFFREACQAEFPDATIVICPEPEYSIAKGLAYAARVDKRLEDFNADIQKYFKSDEIRNEVSASVGWLTVPLASVLSGRIINDVVLKALDLWKSGELRTLEELNGPIIDGTQALLMRLDDIDEVRPVINDWCRKLFSKLQPHIDSICIAHNVDRTGMSLSALHSLNAPSNVNIMLESRFASTLTYVLSGALAATLCGGGSVALIAEGPLGLILGAIIGIVIGFVGKKAVGSALIRMDFKPVLRHMLAGSLKRSLASAKQRKAIEDALIESMQRESFIQQLTDDVTISLEAQVIALAKSVEMPIIQ